MGNAGIVAEALQVEDLADAPGAKLHKFFKELKTFDRRHLPHVPFHIGREIVAQCLGRIKFPVMDAWMKTVQEETVQVISPFVRRQLRNAQRQQAQERGSSRQGLGYGVEHLELLASSEK